MVIEGQERSFNDAGRRKDGLERTAFEYKRSLKPRQSFGAVQLSVIDRLRQTGAHLNLASIYQSDCVIYSLRFNRRE